MSNLITDPQILDAYSRDAVYQGHPDFVHVADDWQVAREVLREAHAKKTPVTFCGSQTSMTGASVADSGIALSLRCKNKIHDLIKTPDGAVVITDPGVVLADLKKIVSAQGFLYPPDPTSFNEALIGSTVATNATGEDTFKYGPTRWYVQELDVVLADGEERTLCRGEPCVCPNLITPWANTRFAPTKNFAGYFLDGDEIDEVIGSEGTLCLIKRLTLRLIKNERDKTFIMVLPFEDLAAAIHAVTLIAPEERTTNYELRSSSARALELIGPGAAAYFSQCPSCPAELKGRECFLYVKEEYRDDADYDQLLSRWFDDLKTIFSAVGNTANLDKIFVARTDAQLKSIHTCRHHIPLKVNEEYFKFNALGGGKVGTDWWVPLHHLTRMMTNTFNEAQGLGIPFLVFGHIGNGHPHWNFLTRTPAEKAKALEFVKHQCRQAVLCGGGVAGEHGIGKIKRYLMPVQYSPKVIAKMRALKQKWDPQWILGQGNIIPK